ncbi:Uncharacterised protein [Serratia ficaria]|nr:Uncharacterised protein [Serratia ficaria]
MQAAFVVLVLPGVAQRLIVLRAIAPGRALYRLPLQLAEGVVVARPTQVAHRIAHLQRRAVQIRVVPIHLRRTAVARLLQRRQRAPRAGRIVAPAAAAAVCPLLLQQPVTLPHKARSLRRFPLVADRLARAAPQRVVVILRVELALRPAAARLYQPVIGVVAIVLLINAVAPADQIAPGVVTVEQLLPMRQAVVGDRRQRQVRVDVALRAALAQQVIRQIVHQPRARFALIGFAVLQQAAFNATNNLMLLLFLFLFLKNRISSFQASILHLIFNVSHIYCKALTIFIATDYLIDLRSPHIFPFLFQIHRIVFN